MSIFRLRSSKKSPTPHQKTMRRRNAPKIGANLPNLQSVLVHHPLSRKRMNPFSCLPARSSRDGAAQDRVHAGDAVAARTAAARAAAQGRALALLQAGEGVREEQLLPGSLRSRSPAGRWPR